MWKSGMAVAIFAAGILSEPNGALAADVDLVTKAAPIERPKLAGTRGGWGQFLIDVHAGTAFGQQHRRRRWAIRPMALRSTGFTNRASSYSIQKMNRQPMWTFAPSGRRDQDRHPGAECIGGDWAAIFQLEAVFDPYSLQLSNSAQSLFDNKGVPLNQQSANSDSSRDAQ